MRTVLLLLFAFSISSAFGQKTIFKKYESDELKDIRDITIHLPKNYEKDSISNFPLAIVLDGHKLFDLYVGTSNYYAAQDNAPEQIVVGINMESTRGKDASYDISNSNLTSDSKRFYRFLRDELIPFIEANYKTSPFLTIVGESLTANFITHFLKEAQPIFNAYICLNPTLAPDINNQIQKYNLDRLSTMDNRFYFYLSGNPFAKGEKLTKIQALGKFVKSIEIQNMGIVFDELTSSPSSSSVIGEGMSRAFAKIFEVYAGITKEEYDKKIKDLSPPDAIAYLETKYLDIEYLFGSNIGVRQRDVIAIEDIILEKENEDYLKDFGEMILKIYPASEMGNYYLGRYFESGNDIKSAIEQYRLGYGKMNPADPNADLYYQNVERLLNKN
ncbi:MAG: hypothetical protein JKY02_09915 [Flavobacteriaceae bacterium]|nr:hypothetical protein [Flavobacteriaceae bacterium]